MPKVKIYNQLGEEIGERELNPQIFAIKINEGLVHQVVVGLQAEGRKVLAHTKGRSEVRGGGRKPWRQKGTGRARHGSIRSPLWKGGGVVFGPTKERNFALKVNKKMKKKALLMALTNKVKDKKLILLEKLDLPTIKTKKMVEVLGKLPLGIKDKNKPKILLVTDKEKGKEIRRSARNLPYIFSVDGENLNVLEVLKSQYLLITLKGLEVIEAFLSLR